MIHIIVIPDYLSLSPNYRGKNKKKKVRYFPLTQVPTYFSAKVPTYITDSYKELPLIVIISCKCFSHIQFKIMLYSV